MTPVSPKYYLISFGLLLVIAIRWRIPSGTPKANPSKARNRVPNRLSSHNLPVYRGFRFRGGRSLAMMVAAGVGSTARHAVRCGFSISPRA